MTLEGLEKRYTSADGQAINEKRAEAFQDIADDLLDYVGQLQRERDEARDAAQGMSNDLTAIGERVEELRAGWEELSEEVEQLQRERDEAVDILRTTMSASKRMVELLHRIEGGQDDRTK